MMSGFDLKQPTLHRGELVSPGVAVGYRSRVMVDQGKIYWREVGQGPALILLHSGWGDGTQWQDLVPELAKSYRCYIPDLPGFGDSTLCANQSVAVTTLVESFVQYVEALNLKRVSLVGYGLGAWVAASYALRFPYAVHRLMLLEPEGVTIPEQKWICRWGQRLIVQTSLWAGLLETLAPLGGVPGPLSRIKTLLTMRRQIIASPISGRLMFARSLKDMQQDFLDDSLAKLLVPTLILGRESAVPRKKILAERYAALCHNAEVGLLPTLPEAQQTELLLHRIQAFMDVEIPYQPVMTRTAPATQAMVQPLALGQPPVPSVAQPEFAPTATAGVPRQPAPKKPAKLRAAAASTAPGAAPVTTPATVTSPA